MKKTFLFLNCLLFTAVFSLAQKSDSTGKLVKISNAGSSMNSSSSIMANISSSPDLSVLANAIKTAELTGTFSAAIPVTLFAPDNEAFEKLAPGQLDTLLLPAHKAELTSLILHHAVSGKLTSKDIGKQIKSGNGRAAFTTLAGDTLTVQLNINRNIVLTDRSGNQSVIARFDLQQGNGMLYILTSVLIQARE
jgi:uncharacterized surface protein with fasciclin (FAS1) repeats